MLNGLKEGLSKIWWLVLLRGIIMILFGLLLVTAPGSTMATLALILGAYWFVQGIFSIVGIFVGASCIHWGWALFDGIIGILAGIFVMNHPLLSAMLIPTTLIIVLAIQGLVMGFINLAQGFRGDGARAIITGSINILFGIVLLMKPMGAAYLVPIIIGVFGICGGIALIVLSFRIKGLAN
jgi:uncharacterized membrane protein HdeD (DUF308 family)